MDFDLKQLTHLDIKDSTPITFEQIEVPSVVMGTEKRFEIINTTIPSVEYATILDGVKIIKLGYCCEPKGIDYPIFLKINGEYRMIRIGKTCMFEAQQENWKNVNAEEVEEKTANIVITGVKVPKDIIFTLDYVV